MASSRFLVGLKNTMNFDTGRLRRQEIKIHSIKIKNIVTNIFVARANLKFCERKNMLIKEKKNFSMNAPKLF